MNALFSRFSPATRARLERIAKFAMTGGIGFVVDVGVLSILTMGFGANPYGARIVAIGVAMTTTWLINRRFTFKVHDKVTDTRAIVAEGGRYGLVAVGAALVNYAAYAACLWGLGRIGIGPASLWPPFSAAFGSGVAMFFSWFGYSRFAFRHADPVPPRR